MLYDPQTQPIRSSVMYYRKWLSPLLLFTPTGSVINLVALQSYVDTRVLQAGTVLAICASVVLYIAIVWIEGGQASTRRKVRKCIEVIPTILMANTLLVLLVGGAMAVVVKLIRSFS